MRITASFIPILALSFVFFVSCQGDTPPDFTGNSSDDTSDAFSDSMDTDSELTGSDFPTDTGWDTGMETEVQTDTDRDTETDTGQVVDTGEDTDNATSARWWECEYPERREITISDVSQIETKNALSVVFDHKSLVSDNLSDPDGKDIRVLYWNGLSYEELPRVLDPESSWNRADTKIWFSFQSSPFTVNDKQKIYLYYGDPSPDSPPDQENEVFHFADYFERKNSSNLGSPWNEWASSNTDVEIKNGALYFEKANDETNRPVAEAIFHPVVTRFRFMLGFDWSAAYEANNYRLHIQFGNHLQMEQPPSQAEEDWFSKAGVGVSLLWAAPSSGMSHHQGFGYEVAGAVTEIAVISGKATIQGYVDVATKKYALSLSDGSSASNIPFSNPIDTIDTVRIFTWSVATGSMSTSSFDYLIVNKVGTSESVATVSTDVSTHDFQYWCP